MAGLGMSNDFNRLKIEEIPNEKNGRETEAQLSARPLAVENETPFESFDLSGKNGVNNDEGNPNDNALEDKTQQLINNVNNSFVELYKSLETEQTKLNELDNRRKTLQIEIQNVKKELDDEILEYPAEFITYDNDDDGVVDIADNSIDIAGDDWNEEKYDEDGEDINETEPIASTSGLNNDQICANSSLIETILPDKTVNYQLEEEPCCSKYLKFGNVKSDEENAATTTSTTTPETETATGTAVLNSKPELTVDDESERIQKNLKSVLTECIIEKMQN